MKDFLQGCNQSLGVVVGFLPIAMSFGAISVQAGLSQAATVGMSMWLYAGASQFAAIEGVKQHLPWFSIVLTILIINLRHIPMSLAAAQKIYNRFDWRKRWILAHGLVDETFALEMSDESHPFSYYIGMHFCCWAAWVIGTWLGCQVGFQLPAKWLQFALPSLFLCLLSSSASRRWSRELMIVLGVGIVLVMMTQGLGSSGILVAIIAIVAIASLFPKLNQAQNHK